MVDLPQKKVGIVACSGEELPEGTVARLAALRVLEQLRPADSVTICLPLFLAGGEGDRAFARFYPTIAIDGCEKRCAARGTEMYSGKPAASVVISELVEEYQLPLPAGTRHLNDAGIQAVDAAAERVAGLVDVLLEKHWNRRTGQFFSLNDQEPQEEKPATCSCGSGIPIQDVMTNGLQVTFIALPIIFQQFKEAGKLPTIETIRELVETVKIYNPFPAEVEDAYAAALMREYTEFFSKESLG
jgi:uncharacterized metal-binding protein